MHRVETSLHNRRLVCQAEIIVGRQHDDVAASFHAHVRALRRLQIIETLVRPGGFERVEFGLEFGSEVGHGSELEDDFAGVAAFDQMHGLIDRFKRQAVRDHRRGVEVA